MYIRIALRYLWMIPSNPIKHSLKLKQRNRSKFKTNLLEILQKILKSFLLSNWMCTVVPGYNLILGPRILAIF
jgi:hypothetical protein